MEKGNYLNDPEISSEVEKVISEDMEIAETLNNIIREMFVIFYILKKKEYAQLMF